MYFEDCDYKLELDEVFQQCNVQCICVILKIVKDMTHMYRKQYAVEENRDPAVCHLLKTLYRMHKS